MIFFHWLLDKWNNRTDTHRKQWYSFIGYLTNETIEQIHIENNAILSIGYLTNETIEQIPIENNDILSLVTWQMKQ